MVIQRNWFFDENLCVCDERKNVKELGLQCVLKARTESKGGVRKFKILQINFDAKDYIGMG